MMGIFCPAFLPGFRRADFIEIFVFTAADRPVFFASFTGLGGVIFPFQLFVCRYFPLRLRNCTKFLLPGRLIIVFTFCICQTVDCYRLIGMTRQTEFCPGTYDPPTPQISKMSGRSNKKKPDKSR
ncbi:MAG: hypothetical protein K6E83_11835 [Clostridium sp.]|nr:hypothetical protein [Clostridium sp.]